MEEFINSIPFGKDVKVLNHDHALMAVEKPEGLVSHPNEPGILRRCLVQAEYKPDEECFFWEENGEEKRLYLLNRLDSPTSGIVLLTPELEMAELVRQAYRRRAVKKKYFAIVQGKFTADEGRWKGKLKRGRSNAGKLRVKGGEGVEVLTDYKVLKSSTKFPRLKLISLKPVTGRTHQLRVQAAMQNCPILGDKTYGDFKFNNHMRKSVGCKRLFLHASYMELSFNAGGVEYGFSAESLMPEEFEALM